ncbi:MAG: hypothetical protein FJ317_07270, partial [SAR202 cluster bacterium]|nr:hypothetical protein [SAR202 cluster bacterium]
QVGLLGLGVWDTSQCGIVAGWSTPVQMVTDAPVLSSKGATWAGCHLAKDKWVLESSAGDVGNAYAWLVKTLWDGNIPSFSQADAAAMAVPAGSEGTLAVFGPRRMDMRRVGLLTGGLLFPAPLTFHEKGRGHLARAALEAAAYSIKGNLEQVESLAGTGAQDVGVGGGMTRSRAFIEILAAVLGRNVMVSPEPATTAVGAYLCAATAAGRFGSLHEAAGWARGRLEKRLLGQDIVYEYKEHYGRWLDAAGKLGEIVL